MKITLLQPIRDFFFPDLPSRKAYVRRAWRLGLISAALLAISAALLWYSVPILLHSHDPETPEEHQLSAVAAAAPEEGGMRWTGRTVCVDLHASNDGKYWYTTSVTKRMDTLPNIRFVYQSNCAAAGYAQIIHVYERKRLNADGTCDYRVYASTVVYDTPDGYTYDGYISRAMVNLNDCYASKLTKDAKMKIGGHEQMHAIGPGHWDVCPSLVGPSCTLSASWPDKPDDDRVRAWYA